MHGKLAQDGRKHVQGEDVGVRALRRQPAQRLGVRDDEKERRGRHAHQRRLQVAQLHALRAHVGRLVRVQQVLQPYITLGIYPAIAMAHEVTVNSAQVACSAVSGCSAHTPVPCILHPSPNFSLTLYKVGHAGPRVTAWMEELLFLGSLLPHHRTINSGKEQRGRACRYMTESE